MCEAKNLGKKTIYQIKLEIDLDQRHVFNKRGPKARCTTHDEDKIKTDLRSNPTLTAAEVKDACNFNFSVRTVNNRIQHANFSRKVVKRKNENKNSATNINLQSTYFDKIYHKLMDQIIYVDETGFNRHLTDRYGYCIVPVKGSQGNSITFIGAISLRGRVIAYSIFEGAADTIILS